MKAGQPLKEMIGTPDYMCIAFTTVIQGLLPVRNCGRNMTCEREVEKRVYDKQQMWEKRDVQDGGGERRI